MAKTGRICVLDVDKQGVKNIRKTDLRPIFIYVSPPSFEVLEKRLRDRKTDTEAAIDKRLKEAKESMEFSRQPGVYDHIVLNDRLDVAYEQFKSILLPVKRKYLFDEVFPFFLFRKSRKSSLNNDLCSDGTRSFFFV